VSGTVRGRIEGRVTGLNEFLTAGTIFKTFFDFLEAHPGTTRVALYYGTAGTGTDYHDGANPFGNQCFAVWRFNTHAGRTWPFYVCLYTPSYTSGTGAGSPDDFAYEGASPVNGTGYVMMSACVGIGGDENPWNGSLNNDGTDTLGTPRWAAPGGGGTAYYAVPHSSNVGQAFAANANDAIGIFTETAAPAACRYAIIADDDWLMFAVDDTDNSAYNQIGLIGMYEPESWVTPVRPFCGVRLDGAITTGQKVDNQGMIVGLLGPRLLGITWNEGMFATALQPDENADQGSGPEFIPQRVGLYSEETPGERGFLGWAPDLFQVVYNMNKLDTDQALLRANLGSGTPPQTNPLLAWDGTTIPGTGVTREGIAFP
jgi:hypothetical protein